MGEVHSAPILQSINYISMHSNCILILYPAVQPHTHPCFIYFFFFWGFGIIKQDNWTRKGYLFLYFLIFFVLFKYIVQRHICVYSTQFPWEVLGKCNKRDKKRFPFQSFFQLLRYFYGSGLTICLLITLGREIINY